MHILICGAGIGGLTAALCLERRGHQVSVFEKAPALSEIGAGLQLSPNAMRVMAALGLDTVLLEVGFQPEFAEMRFGQSGKTIFQIPLREQAIRRWGAPYLNVHRADLVELLSKTLEARAPGCLKLGLEAKSYLEDGDRVKLHLSDGTEIDGDVLVGADGLHSIVRQQMLGEDAPRFTGCLAWRATAPVSELGMYAPPPNTTAWVGQGKHAVTYRLRGGELANFVGVVEGAEAFKESWTEEGRVAEALDDFAGWAPQVRVVLEQTKIVHRWPLYDRVPLKRWSDGPVCLLGDACHPMLPFMAQGAAMAIEDAYCLAQSLSIGSAVPVALQAYETARKPRTSKVQQASRQNKKIFHRRTGLGRLATYGPMQAANTFLPNVVASKQSWLYGFDVTQ